MREGTCVERGRGAEDTGHRERIGSSRCGPRQRLFEQQDISYDNPAVVAEVRSIVAEHIGFRVIAPSMLDL
ncbi:MAG: hypothetical protein ACI89X_003360 [Planctomycetota bacterium]|jgi:hypothetical protein